MAHQAWPGSTWILRRKNSKGAMASRNSGPAIRACHHRQNPLAEGKRNHKPTLNHNSIPSGSFLSLPGQFYTSLGITALTWLEFTKSSIHLSKICAPGMSHRPVAFALQKSRRRYADKMLACSARTAHHTTEKRKNHSGAGSFSLTLF